MALLYYEWFSKMEETLDFAQMKVLFFIYVYYNIIIINFCSGMFNNFKFRCVALIFFHTTFIYYWVSYKDQYGVSYMVGVLAVISAMKFFYQKVILREGDES
jgi:hypothetical protein